MGQRVNCYFVSSTKGWGVWIVRVTLVPIKKHAVEVTPGRENNFKNETVYLVHFALRTLISLQLLSL